MADFQDEYVRQHLNAVRAGAAGRNGEVRPAVSYLQFTEVSPDLKKALKQTMKDSKKKSAAKPKPKKGITKPLSKSGSGTGQQGPPPKSALEKKLLEIGWRRYEDEMRKRNVE